MDNSVKFSRKITIKDKIIIEDIIKTRKKIKKVIIGSKSSYIYIPSSRYFQLSELENNVKEFQMKKNKLVIIREFDKSGRVSIKKGHHKV